MEKRIGELLTEVREWRRSHLAAGRQVEAAACAIRERALMDALGVEWHGGHSTGRHL